MYAVSATLAITGTTFSNNSVSSAQAYGGGAYLSSCMTTMLRCVFMSNFVSIYGGGLFVEYGYITASHTSFDSNHASHGGGLFTYSTTLGFTSSHMTSNYAIHGGGSYTWGFSGSMSKFVDCKWSKNEAHISGAGAYVTGSEAHVFFQAYIFSANTALFDSYRDLLVDSGSIDLSNGCTNGLHNFGTGLLRCYGCSITYPADLNRTRCKPWTPSVDVESGRELAAAIMFNNTVNLLNDITVLSEVAVVGFNPLTGAIFDGNGTFTIYASQEQQRRRSLLALAPTRYQLRQS
jgi:hypothetical protein